MKPVLAGLFSGSEGGPGGVAVGEIQLQSTGPWLLSPRYSEGVNLDSHPFRQNYFFLKDYI